MAIGWDWAKKKEAEPEAKEKQKEKQNKDSLLEKWGGLDENQVKEVKKQG